nr:MAG TPA: hypothetical protein [Bacteriophage sp.]
MAIYQRRHLRCRGVVRSQMRAGGANYYCFSFPYQHNSFKN